MTKTIIPKTLEGAVQRLEEIQKLLTLPFLNEEARNALQWERAAIVYAFTKDEA